jgi:ABC-type transporter Mla subunit MlaD
MSFDTFGRKMADDRTSEFRALAVSLSHELNDIQSLPIKRGKVVPIGGGRDNLNAELRRFHETASGISKDIAATSFLLAELTQLVKSSSALFSDDSQQVNSLVVRIKQSVENLNGRIDKADAFVQQHKRPLGTQAGQEASNLLIELKESFAQTTNSFKKVLEKRTDVMREASDQKKQIYGRVIDQVSLDNKPIVYGSSQPYSYQNVPTLDLTEAMNDGYPSGFNLPRPRKSQIVIYVAVSILMLFPKQMGLLEMHWGPINLQN